MDERHRDVLDAVDLAEIVDADDVFVRDLTGEQQFLLEAFFGFSRSAAATRVGANHFQRDGDAELRVPCLVDRSHAADAEHLDDVVSRAERLSNLERADGQHTFQRRAADRPADGRNGVNRDVDADGAANCGLRVSAQWGERAERRAPWQSRRVERDDTGRHRGVGEHRVTGWTTTG